MKRFMRVILALLVGGIVALSGWGCKKAEGGPGAAGAGGGGGMPVTQVVAIEARREAVAETLSLVGSLVANEMVDIKSETEGLIQEILFEEGRSVKKGDLLVKLDDTKFAASVAEAEASFALAQANFNRLKTLFDNKTISQQELDQAQSSFAVNTATLELKRRQLKDTRIHAPFDGIASVRRVSPGQVITKDTVLTSIVSLDPIKVEINVPERFSGQLKEGQELDLKVAAYGEKVFRGRVYFVSPAMDTATRTVLVKATIPNQNGELKAGMFANLDLTLTVKNDALVIPESALLLSGARVTVFVVGAENKVDIRAVTTGTRLAGIVEITSGLKQGEKVVVEGVQKVRPGAVVSLAPESSMAPYRKSPADGNQAPKL